MLSRREANEQADAILREMRAGWPRSKPLINLLPLYYRMCPELRQFDEPDAFAIVRIANGAVNARPGQVARRFAMGGLVGACFYRFPSFAWLVIPLALVAMVVDFRHVCQEVALTCARMSLRELD